MNHSYGWKPDVPDQRDYTYTVTDISVPTAVDLTSVMPPVYDQGQLGSCTANASGAALQYKREQENKSDFVPSRLFIYYNTRNLEGTTSSDSGASIRDTIKSVSIYGGPDESLWPYDISKFDIQPPQAAYDSGLLDRAVKYQRIARQSIAFKQCLASGNPIVVGISVYESFETIGSDGIGNLPNRTEQLLGGHAVLIVGYDNSTQRFTFRNSWGSNWGKNGYFTLPYAYMSNRHLSSDFWTISLV